VSAACQYDLCDGSGFLYEEETNTARPCRCRAQRISRARARNLSAVIPKRFRDAAWDRKPVVDMEPSTVRGVRTFAEHVTERLDAGDGLRFTGDIGTGKTTLAMLVSKAALEAGRSVAIYSVPRLLTTIRTTFNDDAAHSHAELLDKLAMVDLLHLDDLGAEHSTSWVLEELYSIVNTRYEEKRSIVVTTNLEEDALAEQIGPRTVSRLAEMCWDVPVYGRDARRQFDAA
jgi:DNA replication protein DnaC